MTLERLLEKRNTTNVPLIAVSDEIPKSKDSVQLNEFLPKQNHIDNCDDCGHCYCACNCEH